MLNQMERKKLFEDMLSRHEQDPRVILRHIIDPHILVHMWEGDYLLVSCNTTFYLTRMRKPKVNSKRGHYFNVHGIPKSFYLQHFTEVPPADQLMKE